MKPSYALIATAGIAYAVYFIVGVSTSSEIVASMGQCDGDVVARVQQVGASRSAQFKTPDSCLRVGAYGRIAQAVFQQ